MFWRRSVFVFTAGLPTNQTGRYIFECLAGLQFVYCLFYGRRATADCISFEKREGTLGLLFLTDLKGHDIVVGKLAATSLRGFYALVAVFPVLAIPILLGGVSNAEFWRMVIVLVNTFLFSLAVGIFSSSISRDFRHAMGANMLLFLLIAAIPASAGLAVSYFLRKPISDSLFWSCPAYPFYLCSDTRYAVESTNYWSSIGVTHSITWLLIVLASVVVPRSWHDRPTRSKSNIWTEFWRVWNYGALSKQSAFRRRLLNINAFYWLAARVRQKPVHVWGFLFCMAGWWLAGWITSGRVWLDPTVPILTALMLNSAFKTWVAIEAGQQLSEDKKSGAFELLLTVPLNVREILGGQLLALSRQFALPVLVVLIFETIFMRATIAREIKPMIWLAGMVMLALDLVTLSVVGMLSALTAKSHNHATLRTLTRILCLPWLIVGAVSGASYLYHGMMGKEWGATWKFYVPLWFFAGVVVDLIFGPAAWQQLTKRFHQLALRADKPVIRATAAAAEGTQFADSERTPMLGNPDTVEANEQQEKIKLPNYKTSFRHLPKPVVAGMVVLIFVGVYFPFFRKREVIPPPLIVSIEKTRTPIQISATYGAALMVLPNGTLWRWGYGAAGFSHAIVPEQVGTNDDWVQASVSGNHYLGLRRNGTVWEWGWFNLQRQNSPQQMDPGTNWIAISASAIHAMALRKDQTIWTWGNNSLSQLGNGSGRGDRTNFLQVGTNSGWTAIACNPMGSYAIRSDGTLWAWGSFPILTPGSAINPALPFPAQVSSNTNWLGFVNGSFPMFRSRSGEIWYPFNTLPNANAPIAAGGRLLISNSLPNGIAIATTDGQKVFQLRADGTLWEKPYLASANNLSSSTSTETWRRVGKRSDWISLWSSSSTAFGLTSDGTIWMWGYDPTRPARYSLKSYVQMLQWEVKNKLSGNRLSGTPLASRMGPARTFQKEPRPLLHMKNF